VLDLLGECTPIIFTTQEFRDAYEAGLDAQCGNDQALHTEQKLITEFLQLMLERWDESGKPIALEWSVGFLVGKLHALFVPALKYVDDHGIVEYKSGKAQEWNSELTSDPVPTLALIR
jgi:hypothetical protein